MMSYRVLHSYIYLVLFLFTHGVQRVSADFLSLFSHAGPQLRGACSSPSQCETFPQPAVIKAGFFVAAFEADSAHACAHGC